jgi:beta-galactosidase
VGGVHRWIEHVETALPVRAADAGGHPLWFGTRGLHYLAGWPDRALMAAVLQAALADAGLPAIPLPDGVRIRRRGPLAFAFNHGSGSADLGGLAPAAGSPDWCLGAARLAPAGVAAWRCDGSPGDR